MNAVKSRGASVDSALTVCWRITPTSMAKLPKRILSYHTRRGKPGTTGFSPWGSMRPYKLIRSRRRTIALMIAADATLVVCAPAHTPLDTIEQFIGKNAGWIRRTLARLRQKPRARKKEFVSGEEF